MKKAYVKVKGKNKQSKLPRAYIAASVFCAVLCGVILMSVAKPQKSTEAPDEIQVEKIEGIQIAQTEAPEIIPIEEKTVYQEAPEILKIPEETETAGAFDDGEIKVKMPISGEILEPFSGSKPIKNQATGVWQTHNGIDITAKEGAEIVSPASGKVVAISENSLHATSVTIEHSQGFVSCIYNLASARVQKGDQVSQGDVIGTSGGKGTAENTQNPHIHFELKKNGKYVNPEEYAE